MQFKSKSKECVYSVATLVKCELECGWAYMHSHGL